LDQTYAEFHKLDKSQFAKQVATITDELNEMFDEDKDVINAEIEDDYLPNQLNNTEDEEDEDFIEITDDMLDPTNTELNYKTEEDDADDAIIPASVQHKFAAIPRSIRSLETFYNPNPQDEGENIRGEAAVMVRETNEAAYLATVYYGILEPKNLKEAQNSPDFSNCLEAMCVEFRNKEHKQDWEITPNTSVPTKRKVIGSRWEFSRKDDGSYRARCVAKVFSQIPGKDFQENHAPVVSDTTLHLLMLLKTMLKLEAGQFDIETTFLYGELEEDLWMAIPEGYERYVKEKHKKDNKNNTHCSNLIKATYGVVQEARQWWKKFKELLETLNYIPSRADPCVFIEQENEKDPI
jgi:hypothetical protein